MIQIQEKVTQKIMKKGNTQNVESITFIVKEQEEYGWRQDSA